MTAPVLLTGASGVVGTALRELTSASALVPGRYRTAVEGAGVRIDITRDRLGLDDAAYTELAGSISGIVHAAANTTLNARPDVLDADNLAGTRRVVDLANTAGVPLVYVSTAFIDAIHRPENHTAKLHYAESKKAAEDDVRNRANHYAIVRPSIVIGDSRDGHISAHQGIYHVARLLGEGKLPFIPSGADSLVDVVPQDAVAAALDSLVTFIRQGGLVTGTEIWVTAGRAAPTVGDVIDMMADVLRDVAGQQVRTPRFVDRGMFDRLIRPAFLHELEPRMAHRVTNLVDNVGPYIAIERPLPEPSTTVDPDSLRDSLGISLRRWAAAEYTPPTHRPTPTKEASHA